MTGRTAEMPGTDPSDETLMAYADGMLEDDERRRVEALAATDAGIARRISVFRQSASVAREALSGMAAEPVPEKLLAAVRKMAAETQAKSAPASGPVVVSLQNRRERSQVQQGMGKWWPASIAASIAAVIAGTLGYFASPDKGVSSVAGIGSAAPPALAALLDSLPTGSASGFEGGKITIIATVQLSDGTLCREYEQTAASGGLVIVACRQGKDWVGRMAVATAENQGNFAPASSLAAVDAYLSAAGAGAPLSEEAEVQALRQNP